MKKRKEKGEKELFKALGEEISQVSQEILEDLSRIADGHGWGNPFVTIEPCDGSCGSPLHKYYLVLLFDGELAFHCDHEDLIVFSQATDFGQLGEHSFTTAKREALAEALAEQEIQVRVVDPREVDEYLAEHPELRDQPGGRAEAIAAIGLMMERRERQAREGQSKENTEDGKD